MYKQTKQFSDTLSAVRDEITGMIEVLFTPPPPRLVSFFNLISVKFSNSRRCVDLLLYLTALDLFHVLLNSSKHLLMSCNECME